MVRSPPRFLIVAKLAAELPFLSPPTVRVVVEFIMSCSVDLILSRLILLSVRLLPPPKRIFPVLAMYLLLPVPPTEALERSYCPPLLLFRVVFPPAIRLFESFDWS